MVLPARRNHLAHDDEQARAVQRAKQRASAAGVSFSGIWTWARPSWLGDRRRITKKHDDTVARMKKYWNVLSASESSTAPRRKVAGSAKLVPSSPPVSCLSVSARK